MLRNLYSAMLRCRMVEQRAEQLAQSHKLKVPLNLRRGLEATAIGSMIELRAGDAISSELSIAARLSAGQPVDLYFADLKGASSQYLASAPEAATRAIHLLPQAPTIAAQLNLAAGYALAQKRAQGRNVVLVLLPEGAEALGYWHEAAIVAAAERLAMIFVTMTRMNSNAIGDSNTRQRAASYGIPGITVDGGDVVAVWRVAQESIHRARGGAGPTLIDSQAPARQSKPQPGNGDPLERMQHYLYKRKLWKPAWKDELTRKFTAEIDQAQAVFLRSSETQ